MRAWSVWRLAPQLWGAPGRTGCHRATAERATPQPSTAQRLSRRRTVLRRSAPQRGAVTAETALALPLLAALSLGLVWLVSLGVSQVRAVDAARESARALARGEAVADAVALGGMVAPEGATITVEDHGRTVRVQVRAEVPGPGGLFRFLPSLEVDAEATAAKEPS